MLRSLLLHQRSSGVGALQVESPIRAEQDSNVTTAWPTWTKCLAEHPDRDFTDYIVQGIRDGFRIGLDYANHSCKKATMNMGCCFQMEWHHHS